MTFPSGTLHHGTTFAVDHVPERDVPEAQMPLPQFREMVGQRIVETGDEPFFEGDPDEVAVKGALALVVRRTRWRVVSTLCMDY